MSSETATQKVEIGDVISGKELFEILSVLEAAEDIIEKLDVAAERALAAENKMQQMGFVVGPTGDNKDAQRILSEIGNEAFAAGLALDRYHQSGRRLLEMVVDSRR